MSRRIENAAGSAGRIRYLEHGIYSSVPEHLRAGLWRYLDHGIEPGSFLRAVLENDVEAAIRLADPQSLSGLGAIYALLVRSAPSVAWGSYSRVQAWIDAHKPKDCGVGE